MSILLHPGGGGKTNPGGSKTIGSEKPGRTRPWGVGLAVAPAHVQAIGLSLPPLNPKGRWKRRGKHHSMMADTDVFCPHTGTGVWLAHHFHVVLGHRHHGAI